MKATELAVSSRGAAISRPFAQIFRRYQAEAEVLELVMRLSPALLGLTLHSDHSNEWEPKRWEKCIATLARGIAASAHLHSNRVDTVGH